LRSSADPQSDEASTRIAALERGGLRAGALSALVFEWNNAGLPVLIPSGALNPCPPAQARWPRGRSLLPRGFFVGLPAVVRLGGSSRRAAMGRPFA
jgi:hypothetical protein